MGSSLRPITTSLDPINKSVNSESNFNTAVKGDEWEEISFKNIKVSWKSEEFNDAKTLISALEKLLELWFQLNKPNKKHEENVSEQN